MPNWRSLFLSAATCCLILLAPTGWADGQLSVTVFWTQIWNSADVSGYFTNAGSHVISPLHFGGSCDYEDLVDEWTIATRCTFFLQNTDSELHQARVSTSYKLNTSSWFSLSTVEYNVNPSSALSVDAGERLFLYALSPGQNNIKFRWIIRDEFGVTLSQTETVSVNICHLAAPTLTPTFTPPAAPTPTPAPTASTPMA